MTFLKEINLIAIFKNCVLFYNSLYIISLHHYDRLSLYSVQSKNMYSRLE